MATPLRALLVEDSEDDAAIEVLELRRAGFEPDWRRVDTRDEMVEALASGPWNVVLCDHAMPSFNSQRALEVLREKELDVPLIIVSGMMGEDLAVEALKTGAADYVLKGNLRRLGPAVMRALREDAERRRLREVQESQKMEIVGRLAGGLAHDFNNLLTVILGYAELVLGGMPEGSPERAPITEIRRAGERASSLTRQLLAFSRRQVLEVKALDLTRVVADMEKMIRRLIGEDVRLETTLAPDLRAIRADHGQVEQVILNLVVNARDAMPGEGTLAIRTESAATAEGEEDGFGGVLRAGSWVALSVSDTGVGMDEPTRRRILEPFFTTKAAGKGTGLSLATIHSVVHQSGGQIAVRSEPARGTVFRVLLPSTDEVPAGAEAPSPAPSAPATGLVLLVEDDPAIRVLVAETLRSAGYRVQDVASAEAALAILLEEPRAPVALLLTDLVLQGMTGLELARRFRLRRPGVPALGMTGYIDSRSLEGTIRAAVDGILRKPFSPEVLLRRVAEVLAAARPGG